MLIIQIAQQHDRNFGATGVEHRENQGGGHAARHDKRGDQNHQVGAG